MGFNIGGHNFSAEMARNQNQNSIVNKNLLFHVDAANTNSYPGSGNILYDLSGWGNNGTMYNSPTF